MFFASDNWAGAHPAINERLSKESTRFAAAYGNSELDRSIEARFNEMFERDVAVFFVATGTAANSLALASVARPGGLTFCHSEAHVIEDECGAPDFFSGMRMVAVEGPAGKMLPENLVERISRYPKDAIHHGRAAAITMTQATEVGTIYTLDEIDAIAKIAKDNGLPLHMDGARFAHACATLGCSPSDITWRAGVDVLCFGGTKNGMAVGEAVLFFDPALAQDFDYRCKQAGQLASKMRFLSAPWVGLLESGAWLDNARHGNACATRLASAVVDLPGVELMFPVEANAVFLTAPETVLDGLRARGWRFYTFIGGGARFMFAWDADPARVEELVADLRAVAVGAETVRPRDRTLDQIAGDARRPVAGGEPAMHPRHVEPGTIVVEVDHATPLRNPSTTRFISGASRRKASWP